jgi:hypothetical protein
LSYSFTDFRSLKVATQQVFIVILLALFKTFLIEKH